MAGWAQEAEGIGVYGDRYRQKNRYDVFMRMARVCQADGAAIAARRVASREEPPRKKNTK